MDEYKGNQFWKGFLIGALTFIGIAGLGFVVLCFGFSGIYRTLKEKLSEPGETQVINNIEYETKDRNDYEFLNRFAEIIEKVELNQVLEYDVDKMEDAALRAYIDASGDVYSAYLDEKEWEDMLESSDGSYCGIGISVMQEADTGKTVVVSVFSGGDALTKGMKSGDEIVAVDDTDVTQMDLDGIVSMVRGEEGTQVKIKVYRPSADSYEEMVIERRIVQVDTVYSRMLNDTVGYIQLTEFDRVSIEQVKKALDELSSQGIKELVFDLRSNPGGLLDSVLGIADYFIDKGELIFIMKDKAGNEYKEYSQDKPVFTGKMTVLVNGYSASASEVFTGIMQDYGRAVIMGEQTFGKGIVQSYFKLTGGGALKLTTEHYFTPLGRSIQGIGLTPDIVLADNPDTEADELIDAAVEKLQE